MVRWVLVLAALPLSCGARTGLPLPPADDAAAPADVGDGAYDSDEPDVPEVPWPDAPIPPDAPEIAVLSGLRWELPCKEALELRICTTSERTAVSARVGGPAGARYRLRVIFRGVVEEKEYDGGSTDGRYWQIGGTPHVNNWNSYGLAISSPPQQYYVNRKIHADDYICSPIHYEQVFDVDAGATVTLDAVSYDLKEIRNVDTVGKPIRVPEVPPYPDTFDGQFVQMDVLAAARVY